TLKLTKLSSGTAILGLISLKICPSFLNYVNDYITKSQINITGTNGKTTTSGLLSHLIRCEKKSLITNEFDANMLNGIVNAFALQINPFKKVDYSVIETDEAFLVKIYQRMKGNYLLITNLFEDQTDRFANPMITKSLISGAIDYNPEVQLILNADEPISADLNNLKNPIYYSVNSVKDEKGNLLETAAPIFACPKCGKPLHYDKCYYAQVGHYNCECGYKNSDAKYNADVILYKNYSVIKLAEEEYEIPLVGLFNAYNTLGAIALAKELGLDNIKENLKTFKVAFGRSEKRMLNEHETIIQLIKNPAGTNEVLKTVDLDSNILIAINNNVADGTDISWIYQADFDRLVNANKEIVVTGLCAEDMKSRLISAGVKNVTVISDIDSAIKHVGNVAQNDITILTTYTALLKIDKNKELKKCF
ncbi:DUF1727 domain-containing protein, partial [bacterium]|nr:DUF1727 domain-containing protein [bacterium]